MLENRPIRPVLNDLPRRWISDDYFDLIVWYEAEGTIHGFQLCYGKPFPIHALNWTQPGGFHHFHIDTGEENPFSTSSPVADVASLRFPAAKVREEFLVRGEALPEELRALILNKITEYEARRHP